MTTLPADINFTLNPQAEPARMDKAMSHLDGRLRALEVPAKSLDQVLATLQAIGLTRITDVITPLYASLQEAFQLGVVFAASSTSTVAVGLGSRTFILADEDRERFAAAGYIGVQAVDDPATMLFGPLQSYDRATGTLQIGVAQFLGSAGVTHSAWRISATAAPDFVATATSAQAVGYGVPQALSSGQRKQAKQNSGAAFADIVGLNNSTVLDASAFGSVFWINTSGPINVTLPPIRDLDTRNRVIAFKNNAPFYANIKVSGGAEGIYTETVSAGMTGYAVVALQPGASIVLVTDGNNWVAVEYAPGFNRVPSPDVANGFTAAQKRRLKANIGAFGTDSFLISQTTVCDASCIGACIYLSGASFQLTLPAMSKGDSVKLFNSSGTTKTIAVPAGGYLYFGGGGGANATYTLQPKQAVVIECFIDGQGLIFDAPAATSTPNVDVVQAFTAAQARQGRNNLRSLGYVAVYSAGGANLTLTVDDIGKTFYNDGNNTIAIPADNTCAQGDEIEVIVSSGSTVINMGAGSTFGIYAPGYGAATSITLLPGAYRFRLVSSGWRVSSYSRPLDSYPGVGDVVTTLGTTPPDGTLKINGAYLSRTTYAALWAWAQAKTTIVDDASWSNYGGRFSTGDGSTTFRLPDFRGEFLRGLDDGRGLDTGRAMGAVQGEVLPTHAHQTSIGFDVGSTIYMWADGNGNPVFGSTVLSVGGGTAGKNAGQQSYQGRFAYTRDVIESYGGGLRPRNLPVLYCVRYK